VKYSVCSQELERPIHRDIHLQLELAKEIVLQLESARNHRDLSSMEESLRQDLKMKSLGLALLWRTIVQ
jgi:hypothetical protein